MRSKTKGRCLMAMTPEARLALFTAAKRSGEWEAVAEQLDAHCDALEARWGALKAWVDGQLHLPEQGFECDPATSVLDAMSDLESTPEAP